MNQDIQPFLQPGQCYYLSDGTHFSILEVGKFSSKGELHFSDGDSFEGWMNHGRLREKAVGRLIDPMVLYSRTEPVPWA